MHGQLGPNGLEIGPDPIFPFPGAEDSRLRGALESGASPERCTRKRCVEVGAANADEMLLRRFDGGWSRAEESQPEQALHTETLGEGARCSYELPLAFLATQLGGNERSHIYEAAR